jgi:hypothetical protein
MLSRLTAEEASALGYDLSWSLASEEVGVYLLESGTSRPIEVEETGFSVATIDAEINRMQEISQSFYSKITQ